MWLTARTGAWAPLTGAAASGQPSADSEAEHIDRAQ